MPAPSIWAAADLVTPMAVRVAATLRLADHIAAGVRAPGALAAVVDADPDALGRVMAHLVNAGVLTRSPNGEFGLTDVGEQLRDEAGFRAWFDLHGAVGRGDLCFVELLHTVRTGEPAYPRRYGRGYWDDLTTDAALSASFDALMGSRLAADAPAVAGAYDWDALGHVVDVGGGDGTLLIAILRAHENLRGTVVDLPAPAAAAERAIADADLNDRADAHAGSFFDALPAGAGGYVLSGVLHDWDDASAVRILGRCAEAVRDDGVVLVVDHVDVDAEDNTDGDLRMLCYCGGRERGLDRLEEVAGRAGLALGEVVPAGSRSIVEFRRAG